MEAVRLRLLFEDRYILRKSQRKDGLRRSWILLKPQHQTISDLSSYILHLFRLHHSCPHGLILSMDGFVLPPFESTCVLNDKDIISVKKKGGTLTAMIEVGDGVNFLEGEEVLGRQPVVPGVKLLANQAFEKETGGHDTELEENGNERLEDAAAVEATPDRSTVLKKRKASEKLPSSKKKKKSKLANTGTSLAALEVAEIDVHQDRNKSPHHINVLLKKNDVQEDKWNDIQRKTEKSCSSDGSDLEKRSNLISKSLPDSVRLFQLQEKGEGNVDVSETPGGAKKFPSRSARRKKAKRRWLREQTRLEKELQQKQLLEKDNQQLPSKENFKVSGEHQQPVENGEHDAASDTDGDEDDNVFPIVVRPGHIRFEPLEKADEDQSVWQNQFSMGTFQWNGINSKKKGQKWGKEKIVSSKRNNYKNSSQACAEEVAVEEEMPVNNQVELDKLMPYSSLPKEGDVVAYRLIELSSSWTPELSSFRVGKISHHDSVSNRIKLAPVAEYPITNQENMDKEASGLQPDTSLYAEDGSLEIDHSSLVDLRLVKHGNSNSAISVIDGANENCVHVQDAVASTRPDNSMLPAAAPPKENGATNAWEEIAQALNAKKAELSKEDEWSNTKSSGKSSWSYRALRGSALGPTMAILRAQNEI